MAEKKPEVEEKVEEIAEEGYKLVEVPTQYGLAIKTPSEEYLSTEKAIVLLLNKVEEIKRVVG